ncbi:NAD(P)/FAD-dependent oxidoreductase [Mycolicibacterium celeriflavum]|uniref:Ferredoxin reductase n=1 Tax=Mycolicibacterium celeriflavum TaxID=1249101 RepID=A0A1X0BTR3_MYCCF|nr:FAD/NAD(P)-binding oxidoreductase [Mycolicibacterium celeriflavum]MCV7239896.1 NAD(P)/FAD-dependent oxidoreductase [Mycolicibacterium celeriflavum]ORA47226.1 pyridine nucleotide-disulfide oxidoreductase [Mycolicibacterium celeriflavum]BBY44258.1 ferredoxin reductase [Mycolicibacterium celeriflavum]
MPSSHQLKHVVVVGGGVAGAMAAQTLRVEGYDGELTMVGAEWHAPYHRPALSKKLLTGEVHRAGIDMAPQNELDVRTLRSARAVGLDMTSHTVEVRDGNQHRSLKFDGLVIASGAHAREWPGGPVPFGVMSLRTVDDCLAIRSQLRKHTRVVVIGGGFIGTEVAASLCSLGHKVTLLSRAGALLQTALGQEMGNCWTDLHRDHGVDVRIGVKVDGFAGSRQVKAVRLSDGSKVKADLVLIGLGVEPATDWLQGAGITVDNGVVCDATGAAEGAIGVVAAGDVARWWHPLYQQHLRIEHWDQASRQGVTAARNLLVGPGEAEEYDAVPYFWSDQYDVKLQLVGVPTGYDRVEVIEGDVRDRQFVAAYGKGGSTIAVLSTIPGRVADYRSAIAERTTFPPSLQAQPV